MGSSSSSSILPKFQSLHVVLIGLDYSGKTTVLYRYKLDEFINTVPTIGFNSEKIKSKCGKTKGLSFRFWDAGGSEKLRPLWKSYTRNTDGIIFVVDSCDMERLDEARCELQRVTTCRENLGVPLLIIANKQDLPEAIAVDHLEQELKLKDIRNHCPVHLQSACAITGEGLTEGLDALYAIIQKKKKAAKQQKKLGR
ncbi:ADP-ribosylation factor-like protein 4C [Anneissia japonica]|uniref:ADP-ribosylation factor-like protein 4C n=1 Tax=Anneissia japonica TaxID=1529436 RepID=UPI0014255528|nr:ADP-ribosylation factor-like protein 4C [Anneissia japonica]